MTHFLHYKKVLVLFSLLFLTSLNLFAQEEDLLPPEQAFSLKAWIENDHVIAEFDIADNYYLYRDSFSFTLDTDGVEFGSPSASEGKIKNDEFFGKVEVYRHNARVSLPLIYNGLLKPSEIVIKTSMQGCADVGVCYPPLYQSLTMKTNSSAVVLPVAYQYKPEPKKNNIATKSLQSMNDILAQLTNNLNSNSVGNVVDNIKDTVAPIVAPIIEPIKATVKNDKESSSIDPLGLLQSLGDDLGLANDDEIPSPDQAFRLTAKLDKNNTIQTSIDIYPTTYLYKNKIKAEIVDGKGHEAGTINLPNGDKKHDEFFGDIVVFHKQVKSSIPIISDVNANSQYVVRYGYQGCVEDKICYPPINKYLLVDLNSKNITISDEQPKISQAQLTTQKEQNISSMNPMDLLKSFGDDLGLSNDDEIPSPDQAFHLTAELDANNIIQTSIDIKPTTYLYKDKIKIKLVDGNGHETGAVTLPEGDKKHDEFFGDIVVFHDQVKSSIPIITEVNATSQLVLSYGYQGCVEDKICYPPITKFLLVDLNTKNITISDTKPSINSSKANAASSVETTKAAYAADQQNYASSKGSNQSASLTSAPEQSNQTEQDRFASIIADGNIVLIIGSFFLAGLLLTFTPCVFPMIPILSGIIAGQGDNITTKKAFSLSLVYVLAMASTYAIAGFVMGKFGAEYNIAAWMQDPIVLSVFAGIFVLLSLSMFGFYDIQMPGFIQSRITEFSNKQKGGELVGVGIMGSLSALIVGPCITAPLVGALLFISQTQDPMLGALALFALGLGMGLPLLIIGTSAGKFLPKAGTWMDAVKAVFGVSLLAVAIWMLDRFLASEITMTLVATLLILSGMYIVSAPVKEQMSGWTRIGRGIGFMLTLYGSLYLVGMAAGGDDLIQPLKGIIKVTSGSSGSASPQNDHVVFQRIKGNQGLKEALQQNSGKIVMLDFYADWCISCKEMEKYAFRHPKVLAALNNVTTLQADVTKNDAEDKKLMTSINIYGPPAILFYGKNGIEVPGTRVVGEMTGEEFAAHIVNVMAKIK